MEPSALYDMGSIQTGLGYLFTVKTLAFLALGFALGSSLVRFPVSTMRTSWQSFCPLRF